MATFVKKTWTDRVATNPNRRILTDTISGTTQTVDVTRAEGSVQVQGDAFNANNMNNLEERIETVVNQLNSNFQAGVDEITRAFAEEGIVLSESTPEAIAAAVDEVRVKGRREESTQTLKVSVRVAASGSNFTAQVTLKYRDYSAQYSLPLTFQGSGDQTREFDVVTSLSTARGIINMRQ